MSPTPRVALIAGLISLIALALPVAIVVLMSVGLLTALVLDALAARSKPSVHRRVSGVLARGVQSPLVVEAEVGGASTLQIRQPSTADIRVEPAVAASIEAACRLEAMAMPLRRGRHHLPGVALRTTGPMGLARWDRRDGKESEVVVYPDLPAARRLAMSVRQGRFRDQGGLTRGPLGLGTEFESIREYAPDDDVRHINWSASVRVGRPMSNQYRVDQDRDVICVVDVGRLMAAPLAGRTRLDAALDAVSAVAMVADEVGDRCGAIAFDSELKRQVAPRRRGGRGVIDAVFDLEPATTDSDYQLAFRIVGRAKRALVFVFTDLLEEAAAGPLLEAVPVLARRHVVVVVSATDVDLVDVIRRSPGVVLDAYATVVALDVLNARTQVVQRLRALGAVVLEAPPNALAGACVGAYVRAKIRSRL